MTNLLGLFLRWQNCFRLTTSSYWLIQSALNSTVNKVNSRVLNYQTGWRILYGLDIIQNMPVPLCKTIQNALVYDFWIFFWNRRALNSNFPSRVRPLRRFCFMTLTAMSINSYTNLKQPFVFPHSLTSIGVKPTTKSQYTCTRLTI